MSCIDTETESFEAAYSIGDIHGDSDALLHALSLAGVRPQIDQEETWGWNIEQHAAIVLTGDLFDNARPFSIREKTFLETEKCPSTLRKNEIPNEIRVCIRILSKAAEAASENSSRVIFVCGNHDTHQLLVSKWYHSNRENLRNYAHHLIGITMQYNSNAQMKICDSDKEQEKLEKAYTYCSENAETLLNFAEKWNPDCELKVIHQVENAIYMHGGISIEMIQKFRIFQKYLQGRTEKKFNFFEACNLVYNIFAGHSSYARLVDDDDVSSFFKDVVMGIVENRSLNTADDVRDVQLFMLLNAHSKEFNLKPVYTIVVGHTVHDEPIIRDVPDTNFAFMFGDTAMSIAFQEKSQSSGDYSFEHVNVGRIHFKNEERVFLNTE